MRRHDVSGVPFQGSYVAQRCPVRAQNDLLAPAEPVPVSAFLERLIEGGRRHEGDVLSELAGLHEGLTAPEGRPEHLESWTLEAMAAGPPLIVGGRLPRDEEGRRAGAPDLLVRAEPGGYRAIEVKSHLTLEVAPGRSRKPPVTVSSLERPFFEERALRPGLLGRRNRGDLLQLAHYQRMLEVAGFGATDGRFAGVVGPEGEIVWWDLDEKLWVTPSSVPGQKKRRSTMEVYEHEFDFRLDVLAVAMAHLEDSATELLVVPVRIPECSTCPWWSFCRSRLEEGYGDVSLVTPGVGWLQWKDHRQRGVRDRNDLASLDLRTARLVSGARVDVLHCQDEGRGFPETAPIEAVPGLSEEERDALGREGVTTVGTLRSLSPRTARYRTAINSSSLPGQIDLARAALGPEPCYRARGLDRIGVLRSDVEIDIDMENNFEGRVYLWGALVHQGGPATAAAYLPFTDWSAPLSEEAEAALFVSFWDWLASIRTSATDRGLSFSAYCYSASAERTQMLRLAALVGLAEEVARFLDSDRWVDLYRVVGDQLVTGTGLGLKEIAPVAGFAWPIEDPDGGQSMVRYEEAVNPVVPPDRRRAARQWLLAYNQGDVEASRALREWLDGEGHSIQPIESLDPWSPRPP